MIRTVDAKLLIVAAAMLGLSGCTQSALRLNSDFGSAVRQDTAAQITDPDAHYVGMPAPGSNGARVAAAQHRYETGTVIQPSSISASSNSSGIDNGGSGGPAAPAAGASTGTTTSGP